MEAILEYINKNSDYVSVNKNRVMTFVEKVSDWQYNYWMNDLKKVLNEKECITFAFICQTINFCFWGNESNSNNHQKKYAGSEELFYNIRQIAEKQPSILEINNLINLTENDFKNIIGEEFLQLPLLHERFEMLKDTVSIIYNKKETFYKEIFSITNDLDLLDYITQNFWHFDDKSQYKNRVIRFDKRAKLLVSDLFNLSDTIRNNIGSLKNLTGCADYAIPRLLCENGILVYDKQLLKIINSNMTIDHNSAMEIEIRANTLYAIELIKEALRIRGIYLNSIEIDSIIWNMRTSDKHSMPVHKTITIYY